MIESRSPAISIIIPTRNRCESLRRTLDALKTQTLAPLAMEVVVVLDECTDETKAMLEGYQTNFSLRTFTLDSRRGPAIARNIGARSARAALLLFLDDDVVPDPHLVQVHLDAHQRNPHSVVLGPYRPILQRGADCFRLMQYMWWNDKFRSLQQYGHRFSYTDILSGNLSIEARRFRELGGFDERFPVAHEDYELGIRLIEAGLNVVMDRNATAHHYEHEHMTIDGSFQRARQEGRADVLIARRHPGLVGTLPFASLHEQVSWPHRLIRFLAYHHTALGDRLAEMSALLLPLLDRCRFRRSFYKLHKGLRYYSYVSGVAQETGSVLETGELLEKGRLPERPVHEIDVDLRGGLPGAEARLDRDRPESVRIWHGEQFVGRIPFQPGAEPLRGRHLRPILATSLAWPYLMALVMETARTHQAALGDQPRSFQCSAIHETPHAGKIC
jgi:GT2 family glycosyltransferase